MRLYYEAREIVSEDEEAEFVRVDITDMTEQEKEDVLAEIKDIMDDKEYRLIEHTCHHDGIPPNTPCKMREI